MTAKALVYAEETLGVHEVYEDAEANVKQLDKVLTLLSEARDKKRDLEFRLSDREMEIASDERGKHPEMSAAAMEKHLKQALFKDDAWRELREQLSAVVGEAEGLEYDKHLHDTEIKLATSRLQELGGYLQYLAAVKIASATTTTPEKPA